MSDSKTTDDHTKEEWRGLAIKQGDIIVQMSIALREMIYEATHLSPAEADGSHWCKISGETLRSARGAIND